MKEKHQTDLLVVLAFIVLYGFAFRDFLGMGMLAYGDNQAFAETAQQAFSLFSSAWLPSGQGYFLTHGMKVFYDGILLLLCGDNSALAQKVYMLSPFIIAHVGMYVFLKRYVRSRFARFVSSFVYAVNPMTVGTLIGGAIGMLYVICMFPLAINSLLNMQYQKNRMRNVILFAIFFSIGFNYGVHMFIFILPFVLYVIFKPLFKIKVGSILNSFSKSLKNLSFLFIGMGLAFMLNCISMAPMLGIVFRWFGPVMTMGTASETVIESELRSVWICYGYTADNPPAVFISYLALQWISPHVGYGHNTAIMVFGLVLPFLAFSSLLFRNEKRKKAICGYAAIAILMTLFIYLTALKLTKTLWLNFPFLLSMPNPANPSIMIAFSYSVLMAITLGNLQKMRLIPTVSRRISLRAPAYLTKGGLMISKSVVSITKGGLVIGKGVVSVFLITIVLLGVSVPNWLFFTGHMGPSFTTLPNVTLLGGDGTLASKLIPETYYDIADWVSSHRNSEGFFRTIWLPFEFSEEEIKIRYLDPHTFNVPAGTFKYLVLGQAYYNRFISHSIAENKTRNIGSLLSIANVRYVILYLDSQQWGSPKAYEYSYIVGDPREYAKILNSQTDLKLVHTSKEFLVYENEAFIPHVEAYENVCLIAPQASAMEEGEERANFIELISTLPGFHIGKQLLVFANQLNPEQKDFFNSNSKLFILFNFTNSGEDLSKYDFERSALIFPVYTAPLITIEKHDFNDGLDEWTVRQGSWAVKNGELVQSNLTIPYPYRARAVFGSANWSEYILEGKLRITDGVSGGFTIGYHDDSNNYEIWLGTSDAIVLRKNVGGVNEFIAEKEIPVAHNTWYSIRVVKTGTTIKIYVNGDLQIEATDSSFGTGKAGVITYQAKVHFDNISVYETVYKVPFQVFKNGEYKIALNMKDMGTYKFSFDGTDIQLDNIEQGIFQSRWIVSNPLYIEKGMHEGIIKRVSGNSTLLDSMIIIPASENVTLKDFFSFTQGSSKVNLNTISLTKVEAEIETNGRATPLFVVLGEPYHEKWNAYVNGKSLQHFPAFSFLNAYYINETSTNSIKMEIRYDEQKNRDMLLSVWKISWIVAFIGIICTSRKDLLKLNYFIKRGLKRKRNHTNRNQSLTNFKKTKTNV